MMDYIANAIILSKEQALALTSDAIRVGSVYFFANGRIHGVRSIVPNTIHINNLDGHVIVGSLLDGGYAITAME